MRRATVALAVFCIYAVDFAINGGGCFFVGRCSNVVVLMAYGCSASDRSQPHCGYSCRVSAATWISLG